MTSKRYVKQHALLAICLLVWTGALVATHIPASKIPPVGASDKLLHVLGYFLLASIFWLTLKGYDVKRFMRLACVLSGLMAYGVFDELTQPIFNRRASIYDWLADVAGTIIAVIIMETALFIIQKRRASLTTRHEG